MVELDWQTCCDGLESRKCRGRGVVYFDVGR